MSKDDMWPEQTIPPLGEYPTRASKMGNFPTTIQAIQAIIATEVAEAYKKGYIDGGISALQPSQLEKENL